MARLLWFGLGFLGGMTYASRVIHREHLDLPPGQAPVTDIRVEEKDERSLQEKLADRLEMQAERLGDVIAYKGRELIDALSVAVDHQGHELAGRLRKSAQQQGETGNVTTTSTTFTPGPAPQPNEGGLAGETPHAASPFGEPRPIDLSKTRSPGTAGLEDLR